MKGTNLYLAGMTLALLSLTSCSDPTGFDVPRTYEQTASTPSAGSTADSPASTTSTPTVSTPSTTSSGTGSTSSGTGNSDPSSGSTDPSSGSTGGASTPTPPAPTDTTVTVGSVDITKTASGAYEFTAGGHTYTASYHSTLSSGQDVSIPCGDSRMDMSVDGGFWWSTNSSASTIASGTDSYGYVSYSVVSAVGMSPFYEVQCVESYGMYLLSVTKGVLDYDDDEEEYYISYSIVANETLTASQYAELMAML